MRRNEMLGAVSRSVLGIHTASLALVVVAVLGAAACGSSAKTASDDLTTTSRPTTGTSARNTNPASSTAPASQASSVDLTATGHKVFHIHGTKVKDCSHHPDGSVGFVEISAAQYPALGAGYAVDIAKAADGGVAIANKYGREEDNISANGVTFTPPGTFKLHNVTLKGAYTVTLSGTVVCGT